MVSSDLIDGTLELVVDLLGDNLPGGDHHALEFLRDIENVENLKSFEVKLGPIHKSVHFVFDIDFFVGLANNCNQKVKQNNE